MFAKMILILMFCLLALSEASVINAYQSNLPEDGQLNFTQLATKYGRKSEAFDVQTADGYILTLFHITGNEGKKPVLLMHGILDSADTFLLRGKISIGINLAEAGYDTWVGNFRGNKYSRRNVKLSPDIDKRDFWDFSFHEMGVYDLPAIIDFILKKTSESQLSAIGHSQGTTSFYALASTKPEYNEKMSVFISLAPIAYLSNTGAAVSSLIKLWPVINGVFEGLGLYELFNDNSAANDIIQLLCTDGILGYDLCILGVVGSIAGSDPDQLEPEFVDVIVGHYPAGTSRKAFEHYVQISNDANFAQYDNGILTNLLVYKSEKPPVYNLSQATMPIVLLAATNDGLSGIEDVERLKSELPNVVEYHVMERKEFNHVDYVWGKDIDHYMTPLLRDLLNKYA